jgi:hypothetical protein
MLARTALTNKAGDLASRKRAVVKADLIKEAVEDNIAGHIKAQKEAIECWGENRDRGGGLQQAVYKQTEAVGSKNDGNMVPQVIVQELGE